MRERFEKLNIRPSLLVLIITLIVIVLLTVLYHFGVYVPNAKRTEEKYNNFTQYDNSPQRAGERTLLAELADGSIQLYSDGDYIILVQNGQETEFSGWNKNFSAAKPQLEYYDFNKDGSKDIVILALDDRDEQFDRDTFGLYVLTPSVDVDGNYDYTVYYTNSSGWYSKLFTTAHAQLTQPISTPKRVQIVMDYSDTQFNYNVETGLQYNNGWAWFLTSPKTPDNTAYCTLTDWEYGPCIISLNKDIDNGGADASIDLYVKFAELDEPIIMGSIDCVIAINNGKLHIGQKSLHFTPNDAYYSNDPQVVSETDWSVTYTNPSTAAFSGTTLSELAIGLPYSNENTPFTIGGVTANANAIDKVVLTNKQIKIYAKAGISFDESLAKLPNYDAAIKIKNRLYTVVEGASIDTEGNQQVLTLKLDKSYPREELTDITLTLG